MDRQERLSGILKMVADRTRHDILRRLSRGDASLAEILEETGVDRPSLSRHISLLCLSGLVSTSRTGRARRYSLVREPLVEAIDGIRELVSSGG